MGNSLSKGNYIVALNHIKSKFRKSNPYEISKLSKSKYDKVSDTFNITFINYNLKVKYPSGEIFYEDSKKFNDIASEILILRYLVNSKESILSEKYITYKETEGGYVYYNNFKTRTLQKFINEYGKNTNKFTDNMLKIRASKVNLGDLSYKVKFINEVYVVFVIWEGDEELEPSGNILFDSSINNHFDAEDLAVIPDIILNSI